MKTAVMLALLMLPVAGLESQELGTVHFPTTAGPEAQAHFLRGLALLHSFEYDRAAREFRQAQRIEPGFAMAYWGEALTYTHPIWNQQDRDAARAVLGRLGDTRAARLSRAADARERAYLEAVEILYGDGPKARRDTLYASAMERIVREYPDDQEAKALYALALLGLGQGVRDVPTYMRAAAIAQEVFEANPNHPGAAHYIIHAFDDPVHAPLGLKAARAYSAIAPDAPHAQHMTSHIFVAMGMWDDVVRANEQATAVTARLAGRSRVGCGHYNEWLAYGYAQQGRYRDAARLVMECVEEVESGRRNPVSLGMMKARYLIDTGDWSGTVAAARVDTAQVTPPVRFALDLAAGLEAAAAGESVEARRALSRMEQRLQRSPGGERGNLEVMTLVLRAAVLHAEGRSEEALETAERAARLEADLPYEFGPPATYKPPRELRGELLLSSGRAEEAAKEFRRALERTPGRTQALLGLARAASRAGEVETAAAAYAQLAEIWKAADSALGALREEALGFARRRP